MADPRRGSRFTPEYEFDPRLGYTGRYVEKASGKIVAKATVNAALETQIVKAQGNITTISTSLAKGNISIAEWQTAMKAEVKAIHSMSGALAKGGWANMSQADWGAIGPQSNRQYKFLQNFANEIYTGKVPLENLAGEVNGYLLRRADLYGQAGITTYNEMLQREAARGGATHVRRELDSRAKHCDCCIQQAALGWVPIGDASLLPIGGCTCATNCRCNKLFGRTDEAGNVTAE